MWQANSFFWVFVFLYSLHMAIGFALDWLNLKHTHKHAGQVPAFAAEYLTIDKYKKSIAYEMAKTRLGWAKTLWSSVLLFSLIFSSFFAFLDDFVQSVFHAGLVWHGVFYVLCASLFLSILNLPFGIYFNFVLEERFGFNKMTSKLFAIDTLKGLILGGALMTPLLYVLFALVNEAGALWWVYGFGALMLFQLFTTALFPVIFVPIFYKLSPLENSDLANKIEALAKALNFKMSGIFTIDGSKRSGHSNAFFAGLGKMKRIILFDTLLKNLDEKEIVAVVAHEMGHNVKGHIKKNLILSGFSSFFGLFLLSLLVKWPVFFEAFGGGTPSLHVALTLFSLCSGAFFFPFSVFMNALSRKHEYEADAFAKETLGTSEHMKQALMKLSKDNLSNLTPHPWYSAYHHSHPTTKERIDALS